MLPNESYEEFDSSHGALQELINTIIQHPVPIEPPAEEGVQVAPKPLLLTDKVLELLFLPQGTKKTEATE